MKKILVALFVGMLFLVIVHPVSPATATSQETATVQEATDTPVQPNLAVWRSWHGCGGNFMMGNFGSSAYAQFHISHTSEYDGCLGDTGVRVEGLIGSTGYWAPAGCSMGAIIAGSQPLGCSSCDTSRWDCDTSERWQSIAYRAKLHLCSYAYGCHDEYFQL